MEKCPMLRIAPQDDMSTTASVAPVGPALFNKFFAMKMQKTRASVTGAGTKFYVVNEVV